MRGKLVDQIRTAVAVGGSDPVTNIKLAGLLTRAKSIGLPKSNIEAALKSASGVGGLVRETVVYEGRGPSGYLLLIEAVTDNRNRTRPEVRHIIEKQGGLLGEPGSSTFMFERKAIVQLSSSSDKQLPNDVDPLELAIEVGAEDIDIQHDPNSESGDVVIRLKCEPTELSVVCTAVRDMGLEISSAGVEYLPKSFVTLTQEQFEKAEKLVELLSEQSDVVAVYSNHELTGD
jgi:YebC/PmpR family DNA-binding regulatory protein